MNFKRVSLKDYNLDQLYKMLDKNEDMTSLELAYITSEIVKRTRLTSKVEIKDGFPHLTISFEEGDEENASNA